MDIQKPMDLVNEYIQSFTPITPDPIDSISPWTQKKRVSKTGPLDSMLNPNEQGRFAISFLTNQHKELKETYSMKLISDLLLDGAASPMYKSLIESKLGTDYAPTTGYSTYQSTCHHSFGVQGTSDYEKVRDVVYETLEKSYRNGFRKERIESVLLQFEMATRHRSSMFAMNLGWNTLRFMIHGGDPLIFLDLDKNLKEIRSLIQEPGYIQEKMKHYFLDNNHVLEFLMEADGDHGQKTSTLEANLVADVTSSMTETEFLKWDGLNSDLVKKQNEKSGSSELPMLALSEISTQNTVYETESYLLDPTQNTKLVHRKVDTNGITYLYLKIDISHLDETLKMYIPLFCRALTSLGTKGKPLEILDEKIRLHSGGIGASCVVVPDPNNLTKTKEYIEIYGSCLDEQFAEMTSLVKEIVIDVDWQRQNEFSTCLAGLVTEFSQKVVGEGHSFAMSMAASTLTPFAKRSESWNGLTQLLFLERLDSTNALKVLSTIMPEIVTKSQVGALLVSQSEPSCSLVKEISSVFTSTDTTEQYPPFEQLYDSKAHEMDLGINFVAQSFVCVPFTHTDAPHLKLLSSILTSQFLHTELREKGGAYGGAARYSSMSGLFHFMTYRDPIGYKRTLDTFARSIRWVKENGITDQMVKEAKLDTLKQLDSPVDVGQEGLSDFLYGSIHKEQQKFRDGIFNASKADILGSVVYLEKQSCIAVVGEALQ
jgi:presequence protease